jgi:hypothetical protein
MLLHANAKLGLAGRLALVAAIEDGPSLKAAAADGSFVFKTARRKRPLRERIRFECGCARVLAPVPWGYEFMA